MQTEIQTPIIGDNTLQNIYCVVEIKVNYTDRPVYIVCLTNKDFIRVYSKLMNDYKEDNYIISARKHMYKGTYGVIINDIKLTK